jgi:hypothetical protein
MMNIITAKFSILRQGKRDRSGGRCNGGDDSDQGLNARDDGSNHGSNHGSNSDSHSTDHGSNSTDRPNRNVFDGEDSVNKGDSVSVRSYKEEVRTSTRYKEEVRTSTPPILQIGLSGKRISFSFKRSVPFNADVVYLLKRSDDM